MTTFNLVKQDLNTTRHLHLFKGQPNEKRYTLNLKSKLLIQHKLALIWHLQRREVAGSFSTEFTVSNVCFTNIKIREVHMKSALMQK